MPIAAQSRAARVASRRLNSSGPIQRASKASAHQRSEKPCGGKTERAEPLKETAAVIRIGPRMKA